MVALLSPTTHKLRPGKVSTTTRSLHFCLCLRNYKIFCTKTADHSERITLPLPTSTRAQVFLSIFALMCTDSAWNGLLAPTNMSVLHRKFLRPSVRSCLLPVNPFFINNRRNHCRVGIKAKKKTLSSTTVTSYLFIASRKRMTFKLRLSSRSCNHHKSEESPLVRRACWLTQLLFPTSSSLFWCKRPTCISSSSNCDILIFIHTLRQVNIMSGSAPSSLHLSS